MESLLNTVKLTDSALLFRLVASARRNGAWKVFIENNASKINYLKMFREIPTYRLYYVHSTLLAYERKLNQSLELLIKYHLRWFDVHRRNRRNSPASNERLAWSFGIFNQSGRVTPWNRKLQLRGSVRVLGLFIQNLQARMFENVLQVQMDYRWPRGRSRSDHDECMTVSTMVRTG